MSATLYNRKSPAVKRILQEALELQKDPSIEYFARPLELTPLVQDNIFEWHFTVRGPSGTEFDGGRYHGRILLPNEYPFKPPELMFLTTFLTGWARLTMSLPSVSPTSLLQPNGRFELNKKICLSITGYHPEFWQPAWGSMFVPFYYYCSSSARTFPIFLNSRIATSTALVRTVMVGIMGFFPTKANGAIGGIDYSEEERKILAKRSRSWTCPTCGTSNIEHLSEESETASTRKAAIPKEQQKDLPQFSFVYDEDKKKAATVTASTAVASSSIPVSSKSTVGIPDHITSSIPTGSRTHSTSLESSSDETGITDPMQNSSARQLAGEDLQQARMATTAVVQPRPPRWLDGLIIGLFILIAGLLLRRSDWVTL
ncbi:ubiquitin-conjugating enzyme/RWD-like protein [Jimgerdemannia flammicorona]|uniref:Ubiquitin-conjugating enzyme/RWD-like protein n=1 Tax=Jimgerdemannia flammicorona TaxID=994334 RepID=A0A433QV34_9FUNG|nr:ubiquitin-conjugating enzyme/RWD-like protein [Jimgerdemannia flammicorona]